MTEGGRMKIQNQRISRNSIGKEVEKDIPKVQRGEHVRQDILCKPRKPTATVIPTSD